MRHLSLSLLIFCLCQFSVKAQDLAATGFFQYKDVPLGIVLSDIQRDFNLRFSYSPDVISLEEKISLNLRNQSLSEALHEVYLQTGITYQSIGGNLVLKRDPNWSRPRLISTTLKKQDPEPEEIPKRDPITVPPTLNGKTLQPVQDNRGGGDFTWQLPEIEYQPAEIPREKGSNQVSLVPYVGINAAVDEEEIHNLSVNLLWGMSGSVDGVEVGGFANTVLHNLRGIQVAGFMNTVGGITEGTQVAGAMNMTLGDAKVSQAAGLMNIAAKNLTGSQVSAVGNLINGNADAIQMSGLFNVIGGNAPNSVQMAGLFNHAANGKIGYQISPFFNVADTVSNFQMGILNFADTIEGASLGLWTFVKNGYKPWQIAVDEMHMLSLAKKTGNRKLYNHIELAIHTGLKGWSMGYGIGTAPRISDRWKMNIELVTNLYQHRKFWRPGLNVRNQVKVDFSRHVSKSKSWFAGLTLNVYATDQTDSEGTFIFPSIKSPINSSDSNGQIATKVWLGLQAGFRW
ncbi:MAG: STN domain-containing protein [Saprospiraceae bacterium]